MFIAVGFPKSAREAGAELLYLGLDKALMNAAVKAAAESKKFQKVGLLIKPLWRKASLEAPRYEKTDCSPAHNAGLTAERTAIGAGSTLEEASARGASVKADGAKAAALGAQARLTEAGAKIESHTKATAMITATHKGSPMLPVLLQEAKIKAVHLVKEHAKATAEATAANAYSEAAAAELDLKNEALKTAAEAKAAQEAGADEKAVAEAKAAWETEADAGDKSKKKKK